MAETSRRWSPYVYGNDNPLRFIDSDGRMTKDELMAWYRKNELINFGNSSSGTLTNLIESDIGSTVKGSGLLSVQTPDSKGSDIDLVSEENSESGSQATVYIETDGIGHVYIEVNGTVFSYGRYNGSYSPASGRFGPVGDGVLLKKEGTEAEKFIKERTEKFPTKSYSVNVNASKTYSYLNNMYNSGKATISKTGTSGRVINAYLLVGSNCSTVVCNGLNVGGANLGIFETPSTLNHYLKSIEAVKHGYNPGIWGPKQ